MLIAANWGLFIYGVAIGHVVEIALGYYIGPLVNVVLGVFVLRERPRLLQWVALGIAAAAVLLISRRRRPGPVARSGAGRQRSPPYGLIKKTVPLPADSKPDGRGTRARASLPRRYWSWHCR